MSLGRVGGRAVGRVWANLAALWCYRSLSDQRPALHLTPRQRPRPTEHKQLWLITIGPAGPDSPAQTNRDETSPGRQEANMKIERFYHGYFFKMGPGMMHCSLELSFAYPSTQGNGFSKCFFIKAKMIPFVYSLS